MARKKYTYIMDKSHFKYKRHILFCTQTHDNKPCCAKRGSEAKWRYAKDKIKTMGLHGVNNIRVNTAGCLGFCDSGPVLVVYPDGVWYRYENEVDVDEILEKHVLGGELVQRLLL